ncbi:MAG: 30S ribosomal protein S12 methylthiotransferase RimO [Acidobacteriaceae bacterium]
MSNVLTEEQPASPQKARPRVGFISLGCPKNLVDSEVMMGLLDRAGAEITADAGSAEILVVNTCSFIDRAKQESVDAILEMARLKTAGSARKLIVAGCLVERYRDEIQKNIPEVDAVVGTGELEGILAAAGIAAPAPATVSPFTILSDNGHSSKGAVEVRPGRESQAGTHKNAAGMNFRAEGDRREEQGRFSRASWDGAGVQLPQYLYDHTTPRLRATRGASAYIKIAEGCDHPCSFCVIPNLRGKFRSRRFESVVAEAEALVADGVREITLIGQDTTCYGEDLALKDGLAALLDRLAQVDGLVWLRFLYAYPNRITGRLLETIARHESICRYLDVPLQHASGPVLKTMKRGGNADIFLKMIEKVRRSVPGIALRTSFIVGFPGETDADFEALCDFVAEARFDWMGVFAYSDEEGSGAFGLEKKVPERVIEQRRRALMKLQKGISRPAMRARAGREFDVLVEGESAETPLLWEGRTQFHAPEIDGTVYINDFGPLEGIAPGRFYRCEVTEAHDYDLVARVLGESILDAPRELAGTGATL